MVRTSLAEYLKRLKHMRKMVWKQVP